MSQNDTKNSVFFHQKKEKNSAKNKVKNRTIRVEIRMNPSEYQNLQHLLKRSQHNNMSSFIRSKIFSKKIDTDHKKRLEAYQNAGKLSDALNRIGNNFNQLIHGINTFKTVELKSKEVALIQRLGQRLGAILKILDQEQFE